MGKDGLYRTDVYPGAVNYKAADGSWQPIDNGLHPISENSFRFENGANRYQLKLPPNLQAPVRVGKGGSWIEFSLDGAGSALGAASGPTDTYRNVLPSTDVSYTSSGDAVKEDLTLHDASAPATFSYTLRTSADLTPVTTAQGGIDFRDSSGQPVFGFAAPETQDAAGLEAPALPLGLSGSGGSYTVTLKVDPTWLADSTRVFPVVVDPVTVIYTAGAGDRDCYIWGANATTSYCSASSVNVGYDATGRHRGLIYFDEIDALPAQVQVLYADLQMHLAGETNSTPTSVSAYPVTKQWTNAATWNNADTSVPWTSAGGDYSTGLGFTNPSAGGTVGNWYHWNITAMAQAWHEGTLASDGLLLRATSEVVGNMLDFDSIEAGANAPKLTLTWQHAIGDRPFETFDGGASLTDRMSEQVNMTNGNLLVSANDFSLPGTGLDLSIDRYYNSLTAQDTPDGGGELGKGWRLGTGIDVHLSTLTDGSIAYYGPTGYTISFVKQADGTFTTPPGEDGTLVKNVDGTYTLTYHASGEVLTFNTNLLLASDKDANGNTIAFTYAADSLSPLGYRLTQITDTKGQVTSFSYDTSGHLTTITDPSNRTVVFTYTNGLLATSTDAGGKTTSYGYDKTGELSTITDPLGHQTYLTYATGNQVAFVSLDHGAADQSTTSFAYDPAGCSCTSMWDPDNNKTTYTFNGANEVTNTTDPQGDAELASWNADRKQTTSTLDPASGPAQGTATTSYDSTGEKPLTVTTPTEADKGNSSTQITRLDYGDPANPYDPTKVTDPQSKIITYGYDTKGNLTSVTDQLTTQNKTTSTYNADGTVATATDARGNQTTLAYDTSGNLKTVTKPGPVGADSYTPDALNRVGSSTDGNGQKINYLYDNLDRVTSMAYVGGATITYSYDANGNVLTRTDSHGTTTYTYDGLNRLHTETQPGGQQNLYGYDPAGNLVSVTDTTGTTLYTYTNNQLTSMTDQNNRQITFTYWPDGARKDTIYPNGVTMTASYDDSGRTTGIVSQKPASGTMLTSLTYSYTDPTTGKDTDLLQSVTDKDGNKTTYTYNDALNRLTQTQTKTSSGTITDTRSYGYDGNSDRTSQTVNGTTTNYTYNAANEQTAAGSTTNTYDNAGNQTGSSAGLVITYNHLNQTVSVTPPGGAAENYSYSGPGQSTPTQIGMTSLSNTVFGVAWEGDGTNTTSFTRDPTGVPVEEQTGGFTLYPIWDANGSMSALTSSLDGSTIQTANYDPFGAITSHTGTIDQPCQFDCAQGARTDTHTGLIMGVGGMSGLYNPNTDTPTQTDGIAVVGGDPRLGPDASAWWFLDGGDTELRGALGPADGSAAARFARLGDTLANMTKRMFRRFLESLEGDAVRAGGATRGPEETRIIWRRAEEDGWEIQRRDLRNEDDWAGGPHWDIYNPAMRKRLHFPVPFNP